MAGGAAYIGAQLVGGLLAGGALAGLVSTGLPVTGNLAANGFGEHSPGGFGLGGVLIVEALVTAFFVYIILGATKDDAPKGFAPLAIGFGLLLAHLVAIPISNASINPARSTAVAFFNGNGAGRQLWAFWVAPIVGGLIAGAPSRGSPARPRRHGHQRLDRHVDNAARDAAGTRSSTTEPARRQCSGRSAAYLPSDRMKI